MHIKKNDRGTIKFNMLTYKHTITIFWACHNKFTYSSESDDKKHNCLWKQNKSMWWDYFVSLYCLWYSKPWDFINKTKTLWIRGTSYKWFQSFLRERQQYTLIKESESLLKTISLGDPQDSVRGPLYLSYI